MHLRQPELVPSLVEQPPPLGFDQHGLHLLHLRLRDTSLMPRTSRQRSTRKGWGNPKGTTVPLPG
jgi:hypothetical protein